MAICPLNTESSMRKETDKARQLKKKRHMAWQRCFNTNCEWLCSDDETHLRANTNSSLDKLHQTRYKLRKNSAVYVLNTLQDTELKIRWLLLLMFSSSSEALMKLKNICKHDKEQHINLHTCGCQGDEAEKYFILWILDFAWLIVSGKEHKKNLQPVTLTKFIFFSTFWRQLQTIWS